MPTQALRPVKGRAIRLTRLDPCGDLFESGCNTVVTECFASVAITPVYDPGEQYASRDIWGNLVIADADPEQAMRATVAITLAEASPDTLSILAGQAPVLSEGVAIGTTLGTARNWQAFALEVWTAALGEGCGQWGYFALPYVRNGRPDGTITLQNGTVAFSATATAFPATAAWGDGPYGDDPFVVPFPVGEIYGMVVTSVPPPAPVDLSLCPERLLEGAAFWIDAELSPTT